jgi:very-short-patch-repair endonuclease
MKKKFKKKRMGPKRKFKYTLEEKRAYADALRDEMTPSEKKLWKVLQEWKPVFEAQQVVCGYIPDFICRGRMLVIEVDGPIHLKKRKRDAKRTRHLENQGWRVIRFTNAQVMHRLESVLDRIRNNI